MKRTTRRRNLRLLVCAVSFALTIFTSPRAEAQKNISGDAIRLIVPGPWLLEAARLLRDNPGLDAGVHLTLTSEWEFYKWRPLTGGRSLVDLNGYFFPMTRPRKGFPPKTSLAEADPDVGEVERALRAQIEMAKRLVPRISFLAAHMGAALSTPALVALTDKLSKEYGLPFYNALPGVQRIGRLYNQADTGREKAVAIAGNLETLGPGTWYMIDHAATDTPEMQAIGHDGYRDVAADRAGVVHAWTSDLVKEVVRRRGIKLISFGDVVQEQRQSHD